MVDTEGTRNADDIDRPSRIFPAITMGQFIDHDITFDPLPSLERQNDPDALHNLRPRFDLDSVAGRGPADQPYLYEKSGGTTRMKLGKELAKLWAADQVISLTPTPIMERLEREWGVTPPIGGLDRAIAEVLKRAEQRRKEGKATSPEAGR
jgi:hypothetical protein